VITFLRVLFLLHTGEFEILYIVSNTEAKKKRMMQCILTDLSAAKLGSLHSLHRSRSIFGRMILDEAISALERDLRQTAEPMEQVEYFSLGNSLTRQVAYQSSD